MPFVDAQGQIKKLRPQTRKRKSAPIILDESQIAQLQNTVCDAMGAASLNPKHIAIAKLLHGYRSKHYDTKADAELSAARAKELRQILIAYFDAYNQPQHRDFCKRLRIGRHKKLFRVAHTYAVNTYKTTRPQSADAMVKLIDMIESSILKQQNKASKG